MKHRREEKRDRMKKKATNENDPRMHVQREEECLKIVNIRGDIARSRDEMLLLKARRERESSSSASVVENVEKQNRSSSDKMRQVKHAPSSESRRAL